MKSGQLLVDSAIFSIIVPIIAVVVFLGMSFVNVFFLIAVLFISYLIFSLGTKYGRKYIE